MSMSSLIAEDFTRKLKRSGGSVFVPHVAARLSSTALAAGVTQTQVAALSNALPAAIQTAPDDKKDVTDAIDALTKYIPTESITLYIAAAAVLPGFQHLFAGFDAITLYWCFVVVTPVIFILIYLGALRASEMPILPMQPKQWPLWKFIASIVAFMIWALAIPGAPYLTDINGRALAGFLAIFTSIMLSLIGKIVAPKSPV